MSSREQKQKGGRRLKKPEHNPWLICLAVVAAILAIAIIATAIKRSKFFRNNDHFTIEACISCDNREYDYNTADIGPLTKLSIKIFYSISNDIRIRTPGTYYVTYDSRLPFMKDHVVTVEVVDTTPPELYLAPTLPTVFKSIDEFVEPGYYVEDICDGTDVAVNIETFKSSPCWYTITYTACDKAGNTTQQQREINVVTGSVALTFDDGPSTNITPQILDILAQNNVAATFFILDFEGRKEDIVLREFNEGHTIGYHGMSHEYSKVYSSLEALMVNFYSLEEKVYNLTGYTSKLIRFPGGSSNTVSFNYCKGIMTAAAKETKERGFTYFDWNVDSGDAGSARTSDEIYQNVVSGIRPGRLNVVLMHDAASKAETLYALQRIIDFCFENNYELVRLDSQSKQVTHKIAN